MTKKEFRTLCKQRLKTLPASAKTYRNARVNFYLQRVLKHHSPAYILGYWPFGFEADIRKTLWKLRVKHTIFLPFMDDVSFKMVPLRLPMEHKAFGIYEPRNSDLDIKLIDVAIVPVVGVDGSGRRIGFGKGMYDRFFPTLKSKPLTIFIQPCVCTTPLMVGDDYDIAGDYLITPRGIRRLKENNVKRTTSGRRWSRTKRSSRIFNFKKDFIRSL